MKKTCQDPDSNKKINQTKTTKQQKKNMSTENNPLSRDPYMLYPEKDNGAWVWMHRALCIKTADEIKALISPVYKQATFIVKTDEERITDHARTIRNVIYLCEDRYTSRSFNIFSFTDDWGTPDIAKPAPLAVTDELISGIGVPKGDGSLEWPHLLYHDSEQVIACIKKCYPEFEIDPVPSGTCVSLVGVKNRVGFWINDVGAVITVPSAAWVDKNIVKRHVK